jgi:hypothetical protein
MERGLGRGEIYGWGGEGNEERRNIWMERGVRRGGYTDGDGDEERTDIDGEEREEKRDACIWIGRGMRRGEIWTGRGGRRGEICRM